MESVRVPPCPRVRLRQAERRGDKAQQSPRTRKCISFPHPNRSNTDEKREAAPRSPSVPAQIYRCPRPNPPEMTPFHQIRPGCGAIGGHGPSPLLAERDWLVRINSEFASPLRQLGPRFVVRALPPSRSSACASTSGASRFGQHFSQDRSVRRALGDALWQRGTMAAPAGQPAQAAANRLLACPGVQAQIFNTCSRRTILAWKEKRSTTSRLTQGKSKHGKLKT